MSIRQAWPSLTLLVKISCHYLLTLSLKYKLVQIICNKSYIKMQKLLLELFAYDGIYIFIDSGNLLFRRCLFPIK